MVQRLLRGLRVSPHLSGGSRPRSIILTNRPKSLGGRALLAPWTRSFASRTQNHHATPSPAMPPVKLRDYQQECIQSVVSAFQVGHKRVGISLATGGGKTVIFTHLIDHVEPPQEGATQTLILAHRRELVEQAARHCANTHPDKTVEIEMAASHGSGLADITVASLASLQRDNRLSRYDPSNFKLVLVDEAHHIVSPSYMKILHHFGLSQKQTDSPYLVGVSATFSRFDGLKLGAAIDEIVYHKDYIDMIDEKWLSGVLFTTVQSTADISEVRKMPGAGDFVTSELSNAVNTDQVNSITVRSWLAKASGRKSTLVFCVDLRHVAGLTAKFRQYGVDARFVTGDTDKIERGEILDAFKRGDFPVLLNCGVFTEGTDIPNIDCVVLARPTRSRNLLVQMIGRGMRLHHGKKDCHVIDMVSTLETGIVTVPTLFGLDPGEIVSEASVEEMKNVKERKEAENERHTEAYEETPVTNSEDPPQTVTFTEYESAFDLIADTSSEWHIRSLSQYAWVQVLPFKYILSAEDGTFLRLQRDDAPAEDSDKPLWRAFVTRRLSGVVSKSPYAPPREILSATTLSDAVHGADKYASEHFVHIIISRKAAWRNKPPTEGQLKILNRIQPKHAQLTIDDTTKGKAADMITKIKHGARGRFLEVQADKRRGQRQLKQLKQERLRRLNEVVSVGPLKA